MSRPKLVVEEEISRHGNAPTVAPVKPYTLFAETFNASWRPSSTAFSSGSCAFFRSALARLRAPSSSSRISGRMPLVLFARTNTSPVGDLVRSASGSRPTASGGTSVL